MICHWENSWILAIKEQKVLNYTGISRILFSLFFQLYRFHCHTVSECFFLFWASVLQKTCGARKANLTDGQTTDKAFTKWLLASLSTKIVAAFRGMHVSAAKHSCAWLPWKCDYQESVTTGPTDRRRTKWSLCSTMLCSRHKNGITNEFSTPDEKILILAECSHILVHCTNLSF